MDFPDRDWRADEASRQGWDEDLLADAMRAVAAFGSIAAMVVHRGRVIASQGKETEKVLVRSIRKSFLSALIGRAVERQQIAIDSTLAELGIDDVDPGLTDLERTATVRDLLQARSGVYHAALAETPDMTASKPPRGSALPGTQWHYNNWDFNALGTIYERAVGRSVYSSFDEEIAKPIGMQDFEPGDGAYARGPASCHPAYHFRMTARDLARFGHLFLNDGRWKDRQVIPAEWVRASTRSYSRTPAGGGYGYMWWTYGPDRRSDVDEGAVTTSSLFRYSAEGGYGQLIRIIPDKALLLVNLAESRERSKTDWDDYRSFIRLAMRASPDEARRSPGAAA